MRLVIDSMVDVILDDDVLSKKIVELTIERGGDNNGHRYLEGTYDALPSIDTLWSKRSNIADVVEGELERGFSKQ